MKKIPYCLLIIILASPFTMQAQQVFLATAGSAITIQGGGDLYVDGGIYLDKNTSLVNNGTITINRSGNASADFADHNVDGYTYGNGKFIFSGSGVQHMLSKNIFEQVEVKNGGLDLQSDITSKNWYLETGRIDTHDSYAVVSGVSGDAIAPGTSNEHFKNSWINGNLRRYINPAIVDQYVFPVGNSSSVYVAEMNNLTAQPLQGVKFVNASFGKKTGDDKGLHVVQGNSYCSSVNNSGVWHLVTDAAPVSGNYNLKLSLDHFSGLVNNTINIIRRQDASLNAVDWLIPSGSMSVISGNGVNYAVSNNLPGFGQFGIGVISMVTPVNSFTETKTGSNLQVYPNPVVNNEFYVQYNGFTVNTVRLVAADGKTVACNFNSQKANQLKIFLPVLVSKGIYTLQLITSSGLQTAMISLQ